MPAQRQPARGEIGGARSGRAHAQPQALAQQRLGRVEQAELAVDRAELGEQPGPHQRLVGKRVVEAAGRAIEELAGAHLGGLADAGARVGVGRAEEIGEEDDDLFGLEPGLFGFFGLEAGRVALGREAGREGGGEADDQHRHGRGDGACRRWRPTKRRSW